MMDRIYSNTDAHKNYYTCQTCGGRFNGSHYCVGKTEQTPKPYYEQIKDKDESIGVLLTQLTQAQALIKKLEGAFDKLVAWVNDVGHISTSGMSKIQEIKQVAEFNHVMPENCTHNGKDICMDCQDRFLTTPKE